MSEAVPAYLSICGLPLSGSIVGGIAPGLGQYVTGVLLLIYLLVLVGK